MLLRWQGSAYVDVIWDVLRPKLGRPFALLPNENGRVLARALPHFAAICTEGLFKCRELKGLREVNPLPSTITFLAELQLVFL